MRQNLIPLTGNNSKRTSAARTRKPDRRTHVATAQRLTALLTAAAVASAAWPIGFAYAQNPAPGPDQGRQGSSNPRVPASGEGSGSDQGPPGYQDVSGTMLPVVTLRAPHVSGTPDDLTLLGGAGIPVRLSYGGVLNIASDSLTAHPRKQFYSATGDVRIVATDTSLRASSVVVDTAAVKATALDAQVYQYPYRISGSQIIAQRKRVQVDDARFATAPLGESPFFEIRAKHILLFPARNAGVARNCQLYLLGVRLLTIRLLKFNYAGTNGGRTQQSVLPVIGESGRYGTFAALDEYFGRVRVYALLPTRTAIQARLTDTEHIIHGRSARRTDDSSSEDTDSTDYVALIRRLTTAKRHPLTPGDPLLFHSFLPGADPIRLFAPRSSGGLDISEEVSAHILTTGNEINNLYVSRLPEIRLDGSLPLTRVLPIPKIDGAETFRDYLRRPTFYLGGDTSFGEYDEQPTNIRHARTQYEVSLFSTPLLTGRDTVFIPRLQFTDNHYSGDQDEYRYLQTSLLLQHYFTDRSAVGVQYLLSSVGGQSPFNFDVLNTTQEVDGRVQIGNHRIVLAGLVKFDAVRDRVFDYEITVAPAVHGVVPQISYDFASQSTEFGIQIPGVTF